MRSRGGRRSEGHGEIATKRNWMSRSFGFGIVYMALKLAMNYDGFLCRLVTGFGS